MGIDVKETRREINNFIPVASSIMITFASLTSALANETRDRCKGQK